MGRHSHTHGRALLAEEAGRRDEAAQLYAEAAEGWQEWGSKPLRAYALVGVGNCAGDTAALAEGQEIFAALGATPRVSGTCVGASAAGVGARRGCAFLCLRQLCRGKRRAVEDVALRRLDLREPVLVHDFS